MSSFFYDYLIGTLNFTLRFVYVVENVRRYSNTVIHVQNRWADDVQNITEETYTIVVLFKREY